MLVAIRSGRCRLLPAAEGQPGAAVGTLKLGIDCAGSITAAVEQRRRRLRQHAAGIGSATRRPQRGAGSGPWSAPVQVSNGHVGAAWPNWRSTTPVPRFRRVAGRAPGNLSSIVAAARCRGRGWRRRRCRRRPANPPGAPSPRSTPPATRRSATSMAWHGRRDAAGLRCVVGPGTGFGRAAGALSGPRHERGGRHLAARQAYDPVSGATSIWRRLWRAGAWSTATRLSGRNDADLPSAAFSGDGSLAVVSWTDDTALVARAAQRQGGAGAPVARSSCWGGSVPVAAGGGSGSRGLGADGRQQPERGATRRRDALRVAMRRRRADELRLPRRSAMKSAHPAGRRARRSDGGHAVVAATTARELPVELQRAGRGAGGAGSRSGLLRRPPAASGQASCHGAQADAARPPRGDRQADLPLAPAANPERFSDQPRSTNGSAATATSSAASARRAKPTCWPG